MSKAGGGPTRRSQRNLPSEKLEAKDLQQVTQDFASADLADIVLEEASQPKLRSSSHDSDGSKKSGDSESHIIGMATPGKRKFLGQTMGFELRTPEKLQFEGTEGETEELEVLKCVLTFGKERAPTIVPKGQGRHVSSHALLEEVLLSRLNGQDVEDAMDVVQQTVMEYVDEGSPRMRQFSQFIRQVKGDLKSKGIVSKDERKFIYEADKAIPRQAAETVSRLEEIIKSLPEGDATRETFNSALESAKATQQIAHQKSELVSPMETRNKTKKADLWAHQQAIINVTKAAMITLNHMEGIAFTGLVPKTSQELGAEGGKISSIMEKFRSGEIGVGRNSYAKVPKLISDLLDYPKDDIIRRSTEAGKDSAKIVEDFYQNLRRHEKLCYDSFECLGEIDSENRAGIRREFLKQILDSGWAQYLKQSGAEKNPKKVLERYELGLDLSHEGEIHLVTKSTSQESRHLKDVLKKPNLATDEIELHTNDKVVNAAAQKIGSFAKAVLQRRAEKAAREVKSKGGEL